MQLNISYHGTYTYIQIQTSDKSHNTGGYFRMSNTILCDSQPQQFQKWKK